MKLLSLSLVLLACSAQAQAQGSYPIADAVAAKLVQKYNSATCEQLAQERAAPASAQKEAMQAKVGQQLQQDAGMRADFVNKVAPTIVNKMIVCGFVP